MKQLSYETPELEIIEFEAEDIITTSPVIDPDDNETPILPLYGNN